MKVTIEKQPKATLKITVSVPADRVMEAYNHVLFHIAETIEISGFRKGKAPIELVEKSVKEPELNGEVVNHLLREYYSQALKKNKVLTLGNPKVTIKKYDKNSDFEFEAIVATRPEIKLNDYKKELTKKLEEKKELVPNDIIEAISTNCEVEFSDLLVEEEVTRMLSRLLEQAESIGLGIEQYLTAQNKTPESLRKEYEETAIKSLRSEFGLSRAIEEEKIEVTEAEIEDAINALPDQKLKERLQNPTDKWYIKSILLKNKLITKVTEEFKKDNKNDK